MWPTNDSDWAAGTLSPCLAWTRHVILWLGWHAQWLGPCIQYWWYGAIALATGKAWLQAINILLPPGSYFVCGR